MIPKQREFPSDAVLVQILERRLEEEPIQSDRHQTAHHTILIGVQWASPLPTRHTHGDRLAKMVETIHDHQFLVAEPACKATRIAAVAMNRLWRMSYGDDEENTKLAVDCKQAVLLVQATQFRANMSNQ